MKYADLIAKLTLEEKAGLTSGRDFWHTKAVERLGIPSEMMTDGPHGLRKQESDSDALGLGRSVPATCFPTASALANSWDETLLSAVGRALGEEAVAQGVGMVLGPGVNIKRSPLCGRNFEYFSEDPLLSGKLAAAMIRGIQSTGVSACVKHFAANSQELRRMATDSVMDERTLREIYLPAFETAVKEGGVRSLMTAYNRLNGTYCNENEHLLRDILRGEWGFDGLVVSDWGGNNDRVAAVRAGSSLEMPASNGETDRHIVEAVQNGTLDEALLDEQVDHVLDFIFTAQKALACGGVFEGTAHHALAAKAAAESAVLLKNENTVTLVAGYHTTAGSGWRPLEVELPLTPAAPAKTPVLTDTYGSVSVLLDGDIRTVTIKHTPEIIAWAEDYGIRLDGDVTLPIRNAYNNYVDMQRPQQHRHRFYRAADPHRL